MYPAAIQPAEEGSYIEPIYAVNLWRTMIFCPLHPLYF